MTKLISNHTKGRAKSARPLVLLCLVAALLALPAVAAPIANAAAPLTPALTVTSPPSSASAPAQVTEPFILGEGEPSVHPAQLGGSLLERSLVTASATKNPGFAIEIYANDPTCTGSPVAQGSAAELESPGIQVEVPPDSITTFYAAQVDPTDLGHPSDCSAGLPYWEGAVAVTPPGENPGGGAPGGGSPGAGSPGAGVSPGAPAGSTAHPDAPHLRTIPGGIANDNTPIVTGTAPGAAAVKIFTDGACDGAPVAKGSLAQLEAGFKVQVVDNAAVAFYGVSVGSRGAQSRCSDPVYYVEDSTIPHTRITMGPASKTRKRNAVFRFTDTTGNAPGTTFFCKVDRAKWKRCSSPLRLKRLHLKRHTVRVKATDPAGNAELKAAQRRFKVVPPL